jgi:uncharacterized RDD family membrane protein YckC
MMAVDPFAAARLDPIPAPIVEPFQYVGFWARVFASIVDSILLTILLVVMSVLIYGSVELTDAPFDLTHLLTNVIAPAAIVILFWIRRQATPGKVMIHARIVDAGTGADPRPGQLVLRYLGYYVSGICFGLGFLWVAFDRRKQGWHDKLATTVVVRDHDPLLDTPTRAAG